MIFNLKPFNLKTLQLLSGFRIDNIYKMLSYIPYYYYYLYKSVCFYIKNANYLLKFATLIKAKGAQETISIHKKND